MSTRANVLVVDDENLIRWSIVRSVQKRGYAGIEAADAREAMERAKHADAVILDYRLPDGSGFDVLRELRKSQPTLPVIMLTGHANIEHAVQAMKLGAYHYLSKPFDLELMLGLIEEALGSGARRAPVARITSASIAGDSPIIHEVRRAISRAAVSASSTVLLTGESGTGKDLAARAIHGESGRANGPYVSVTCSAIPAQLLESELFGHERGAFSDARVRRIGLLELADLGTLFLDEIGDMALEMQAKLLRFLEAKTFRRAGGTDEIQPDLRIVAATNVELDLAVKQGTFRQDLYDRLAVVQLRMPSLRERREDIPLLAKLFLEQLGLELERSARFAPGTLEVLRQRPWPGNVRQLRNAIERALLLHETEELGPSAFEEPAGPTQEGNVQLPSTGLDIELLERELLVQALERAGGNQRIAGSMLGMNRDQVRYRMAKYGIPSRRRRIDST